MKIKRNEKGRIGRKKDIKYDFEALNKKLVGRRVYFRIILVLTAITLLWHCNSPALGFKFSGGCLISWRFWLRIRIVWWVPRWCRFRVWEFGSSTFCWFCDCYWGFSVIYGFLVAIGSCRCCFSFTLTQSITPRAIWSNAISRWISTFFIRLLNSIKNCLWPWVKSCG